MTPESQRIALVEACPFVKKIDRQLVWLCNGKWVEFDPLNDLNAMHESEKVLTDEQRGQMINALCEIVRRDHNPEAGPMTAITAAFFATAAQRAEAFLRTLNR
jgi:hypothetical protein